jgi:hypothetical protein
VCCGVGCPARDRHIEAIAIERPRDLASIRAAGRVDITKCGAGNRAHLSDERVHPEAAWRRPAAFRDPIGPKHGIKVIGSLLCSLRARAVFGR